MHHLYTDSFFQRDPVIDLSFGVFMVVQSLLPNLCLLLVQALCRVFHHIYEQQSHLAPFVRTYHVLMDSFKRLN